nr:transmembrane gamma-carboxyglutamic acid protein 4 isoform X2 [Caretta caretta]
MLRLVWGRGGGRHLERGSAPLVGAGCSGQTPYGQARCRLGRLSVKRRLGHVILAAPSPASAAVQGERGWCLSPAPQPGVRALQLEQMTFWKEYSIKGPSTKFGGEATQNIDVTGLLTGLVATGVLLVTTGLLIYYFYKNRCKARQPPGYSDSVRSRRHEEVSLNPLSLRTDESGLPTYEEAVTLGGKYDVPPPPYLGPAKGFKMFKKSLSLPAP